MTIKKRKYNTFYSFITRLIKTYYPQANITLELKKTINIFIIYISQNIIDKTVQLCKYSPFQKIDDKSVSSVIQLFLPPTITDPLLINVNDKLKNFRMCHIKGLKKNIKAGLIFQPSRFKKMFQKSKLTEQEVYQTSYVCLTAIIEYFIDLVIKESFKLVQQDRKITITTKYFFNALNAERFNEWKPLYKNFV